MGREAGGVAGRSGVPVRRRPGECADESGAEHDGSSRSAGGSNERARSAHGAADI